MLHEFSLIIADEGASLQLHVKAARSPHASAAISYSLLHIHINASKLINGQTSMMHNRLFIVDFSSTKATLQVTLFSHWLLPSISLLAFTGRRQLPSLTQKEAHNTI